MVSGIRSGIGRAPIILLVSLAFCLGVSRAYSEDTGVNGKESQESISREAKESLSRAQISREHHLLMQQLIDSLKETVDLLQRSTGATGSVDREEINAKVSALAKKVDELSKKHEALMKIVDDLYKEVSNKKKPAEDKGPSGRP